MGPRDQDLVMAEFASCQMEYKYLAHLTGNRDYYLKVSIAIPVLDATHVDNAI